jgi:hypothetical protein
MQPIVEHRDFVLNGALIKPERSLNSPPRPCCRKRPETRDRSRKKRPRGRWVNFEEWCCQMGLNHRPLHYQWSALPLSYGSMRPRAGKRPTRRVDPCHKGRRCASAGLALPCSPKGPPSRRTTGSVCERNSMFSATIESRKSFLLCGRSKMRHDKDNRGRQPGKGAHDARRERLKLALRENLKRRKSQGRGRDDFTISSSDPDAVTVADPDKNHPGK